MERLVFWTNSPAESRPEDLQTAREQLETVTPTGIGLPSRDL
jgi:hypothetical protein